MELINSYFNKESFDSHIRLNSKMKDQVKKPNNMALLYDKLIKTIKESENTLHTSIIICNYLFANFKCVLLESEV